MTIINTDIFSDIAESNSLTGNWFLIQWTPDAATSEKLNIGVGFRDREGSVSVKTIREFNRLGCLYDNKSYEYHAEMACAVVQEALEKNSFNFFDYNRNVQILDKGFAQGETEDSILERLYKEVVTLGRPTSRQHTRDFSYITRQAIIKKVKPTLKELLGIEFSNYVPDNSQLMVDNIALDLPYRKNKGIGNLVSAAFAEPLRVKSNLVDGFRDIEIALRARKEEFDVSALFIMLPGPGLKSIQQKLIEKQIRDLELQIDVMREPIKVVKDDQFDGMAEQICEWCVS